MENSGPTPRRAWPGKLGKTGAEQVGRRLAAAVRRNTLTGRKGGGNGGEKRTWMSSSSLWDYITSCAGWQNDDRTTAK